MTARKAGNPLSFHVFHKIDIRHGHSHCKETDANWKCPGCENITCWCCGTAETEFCDVCSVLMSGVPDPRKRKNGKKRKAKAMGGDQVSRRPG